MINAEPVMKKKRQQRQHAATAAATEMAAAADGTAEAKEKTESATTTVVSGAKEAKDKDEEILALIQGRRTIKKDEKERIREVSKKIKNASEKKREMQCKTKFRRFWKNSKGTKNISNVKSAKKRIFIPRVKNKKGELIITRKGIANVFAEFYAKLYEDEEGKRTTKKKRNLKRALNAKTNTRVHEQRDSRCHRPPQRRKSRRQWRSAS